MKKKDRFIAIRNQADTSTLELFFLDVIAETFDWYTGTTSPVQQVIDKVNAYNPSKIIVTIDSEGGDAQCGMSIYNFLKRCNAKVEVEIIGLAASIASVIAMAANKGKLRIAKNAFMMIHNAEGGVWGTSDEIRKGADLVDMYTTQIVDIYSQRTGKTVDEIKKLMENGDYWMAGEDAVTQGFADETFNDTPNLQIAARLDPKVYKNLPAQIRAQLKPAAGDPEDDKTFITNKFDEMKKFFTEIVNAVKGIKPSTDPAVSITNQIADAISTPFEQLAEEIETTISSKVNETIAGKTVNDAIGVQVANAVTASLDLSKDGPVKTAFDAVVKNAVDASVKTAVDAAVTAATKDLKEKNDALELDIKNLMGGKVTAPVNQGDTIQPIGGFKK